MTSVDKQDRLSNKKVSLYLSLATLALCLAYYYSAVIDINFFKTSLPDLGPMPDGQEYLASAVSFVKYGKFGLRIGNDFLPSRYPFGFSLILVPFAYFSTPEKLVRVPYIVNGLIGLAMLIGTFLFYFLQKRFIASGLSVLLLVTLPSFIIFSRSSLSENLGVFILLISLLLAYFSICTRNSSYLVVSAFILGLGLSVRLQLILFVPMLGASLFLKNKGSNVSENLRERLIYLLLIFLAFLLGALPLLIYNLKTFGSLLSTGYEFWVPGTVTFKLDFFFLNIASLWRDFSLSRVDYKVANLFGPGMYFTPVFLVFALISSIYVFLRVGLGGKIVALGVFSYLLGTLFYPYSYDARFYYPILIISAFLITQLMEDFLFFPKEFGSHYPAIRFLTRNYYGSSKKALIFLIFLILVGFPSASGFPPGFNFSQTTALLEKSYLGNQSFLYPPIIAYLRSHENGRKTLLVTDIIPILPTTILQENITVIPVNEHHEFMHSNMWKFGLVERDGYILKALSLGDRLVYISKEVVDPNQILPVSDSIWKKVSSENDSFIIAELVSKSKLSEEEINR